MAAGGRKDNFINKPSEKNYIIYIIISIQIDSDELICIISGIQFPL